MTLLSTTVEMRAGKKLTASKMALAAEAREILAQLCEEIRHKDLFSSEAVRVMVEDLGLNRSRDLALAFRQPKMSIADRVQHTKKKMEESRDHTASAHAALSHSTSFGLSFESHGSQRLMASKSSLMVLTSVSFPNNSTVHIPTLASSMSSMKQTPTSETQSALVKTSFGKDSSSVAMSSLEAVNQRLDARMNGPTYFTVVRAIDHIINSAEKSNYMSAGQHSVPIIFKGPNGVAAGVGAQNSVLCCLVCFLSCLKVLAPYSIIRCKRLAESCY